MRRPNRDVLSTHAIIASPKTGILKLSTVHGVGVGTRQRNEAVLDVLRDARVDFAVRPLKIGVGDERRPAVPGAGDVDLVEIELFDQPIVRCA
jgi:hypothetical protein